MQGFIVNINKVKDEDLIVSLISKNSLHTLYRFYGARHGTINIGFMLDFNIEDSSKSTISRLKNVVHIGYPWLGDNKLLRVWQDFLKLFYKHLKDVDKLSEFYFNLLKTASINWDKQNPQRVAIESYVKLLENEGRLHLELDCFLCSDTIKGNISIMRSFLPTHQKCTNTLGINKKALQELFVNKSSLFLSDKEVERLWSVLKEGL